MKITCHSNTTRCREMENLRISDW